MGDTVFGEAIDGEEVWEFAGHEQADVCPGAALVSAASSNRKLRKSRWVAAYAASALKLSMISLSRGSETV